MKLSKRYLHQIEELKTVFLDAEDAFSAGHPVDRVLTGIFRKNSKYGSRDRRFISNAIFGYFRWLGWLQQLKLADLDLKLLLGYLLDTNEINDFIEFWAKIGGVNPASILQFKNDKRMEIQQKAEIMGRYISDTDLRLLNPQNFPERWNPRTITAFQCRPSLWVRFVKRINQSFLDFLCQKKVEYKTTEQDRCALEILSPVNLNESPDYRAGQLEVQDIASQWVGKLCRPKPDEIWWDVCAGSGGKALHLSSLMKGNGLVYATEVNSRYYNELKRRSKRHLVYNNIKTMMWDGLSLPEFHNKIDGVLIDAPCSSSGTWRRSPDLRWNTTREMIQKYADLQLTILSTVANLEPKPSVLVYATCSIFPEENEQVIEMFLERSGEFQVCDISNSYSEEASEKGIYLMPPRINGNGMFVSRLIRK